MNLMLNMLNMLNIQHEPANFQNFMLNIQHGPRGAKLDRVSVLRFSGAKLDRVSVLRFSGAKLDRVSVLRFSGAKLDRVGDWPWVVIGSSVLWHYFLPSPENPLDKCNLIGYSNLCMQQADIINDNTTKSTVEEVLSLPDTCLTACNLNGAAVFFFKKKD